MSPWKKVIVYAGLFNGLAMVGFYLANMLMWTLSLVAGSVLPVFLSALLLFVADNINQKDYKKLQVLNGIGFLVKIVFIGLWMFLMSMNDEINMTIFVISLLTNFLAWHMVEAYHWSLFMRQNAKA